MGVSVGVGWRGLKLQVGNCGGLGLGVGGGVTAGMPAQ